MGYPMALNLRKGLDPSYSLLICDVVDDAVVRFLRDSKEHGPVNVIRNGYQAASKAVCLAITVRNILTKKHHRTLLSQCYQTLMP